MKNLTLKNIALLIAAASVVTLTFVYIAQYGFNLQPCILCLYQRKPYFIVIFFSLLATFLADKKQRMAFNLLLLSALAFAIGAAIAGFHTGVERGWWTGLASCGDALLPENATVEQLQAYIMNRPVVRCDVAGWKFMGLSMSNYNFLLSVALTVFTVTATLKRKP